MKAPHDLVRISTGNAPKIKRIWYFYFGFSFRH